MNRLLLSICLSLIAISGYCQSTNESTVIMQKFLAPSIINNIGGEDPMRQLTIYLPLGYDKSTAAYPVSYFLHGYASTDTEMMQWLGFKSLMDSAIKSGKLHPMILVIPNSDTKYRGSFYTNSSLTGYWADFIGKDVVNYIDTNYRTIVKGMHFSDEFHVNNLAMKKLLQVKDMDSLLKKATPETSFEEFPFFEMLFASLARTYSPNETIQELQAELPVHYDGEKMMVNSEVLKKWEYNFAINMIEDHIPALKSLTALKMDWGRNDEFPHIPNTNLQFSKRLEALGIKHFAEEYIGTHVDRLGGFEGRIFTEVLPFFNRYLSDPAILSKKQK